MIPAIQTYSTTVFEASVPNNKTIKECINKGEAVDCFISKSSLKKESILDSLKNIFLEMFPKLDPEHRKLYKTHVSSDVVQVKPAKENHSRDYGMDREKRLRSYDKTMPEFGIDKTGYGFGRVDDLF